MAKSKAIKAVCYNALKTAEKTSEKVILIDRLCDKRVEKNICKNFHQVWSHHVLWKLLIKCVRKYRLRNKRVKTKLSKKCSSHFKPSSALRAKRAVTATYVINQLWWYDTMAVVWVITYIVIIHMGMPSCALQAKWAVTASIIQFYGIGELVVDGLGISQYGRTVNYLVLQFYRTAVNRKIRPCRPYFTAVPDRTFMVVDVHAYT